MDTLIKFALYSLFAYALLILIGFLMQRRMLYFPEVKAPSPAFLQAYGLEPWPGGDDPVRGYTAIEKRAQRKGTVVVFHGNAGAAYHRDYYIKVLEPLGYRVLLAEYPGYGGRSGELSEQSFIADGSETVRRARGQFGNPVYLAGESMGCAVATGVAAAAAVHPEIGIRGIALFTPWDTLPDLAQSIYWFLPVRTLLRDRYDNIGNLEKFPGPVAVIVAQQDRVVPVERGLTLYRILEGPKRVWKLPSAGHNDWFGRIPAEQWQEIFDYLAGSNGASAEP